jgi:hypothetical protein
MRSLLANLGALVAATISFAVTLGMLLRQAPRLVAAGILAVAALAQVGWYYARFSMMGTEDGRAAGSRWGAWSISSHWCNSGRWWRAGSSFISYWRISHIAKRARNT